MSSVLVTGGAGYIGSHTCKALSLQGFDPVVVDNLSVGHRDFVSWGRLYECDVRDTAAMIPIMEELRPTAVIHFAASAYVGESMEKPQKYYDNNVSGALSVLEVMHATGCKNLVFSSTCAVYGVPQALPISVHAPCAPINNYGRSKLMVEQIIRDCAKAYGLNAVLLRYFNAAGADFDAEIGERHNPETHLIPNVIKAALDKAKPLQVFGDDYPTRDGFCVRDYVHVNDLASAHVMSLAYMRNAPGVHTFNLGTENGISIQQVIDTVQQETGNQVPYSICPRRPGDPAELYADVRFTESELGWKTQFSDIDSIISSAVRWAKKERNK